METKDFIEFVNNPKFIPGIYNYCDRWCERCAFNTRCSVYAIEKEEGEPESTDVDNAKFWQKLESIFAQTKDLITTWAKEHDVDLSESALEEVGRIKSKRRLDARTHRLAKAGEAYASAVTRWFNEEFKPLDTIADTAETDLGIVEDTDCLEDAVEVIHWYQFFIAVKTMRGLMSRENEENEDLADYEDCEIPKDSDGSIKVALIAIERSIGAWRTVQLLRPELFHSITSFIVRLENLRQETELEFPHAREFIRVGFDEPELIMVN